MGTFEKELIVNGSLNPSLTLDEILENFDDQGLAFAAWSIIVKMNVHYKIDGLPEYSDVNKNPRQHLLDAWERHERLMEMLEFIRKEQHVQEGRDLHEVVSTIATPRNHALRLFPYQAIGYIGCLSDWENFESTRVQHVIEKIEALGIRADFGINNPNTGKEVLSWEIVGDSYVTLCIDCMGKTKSRVLNDFDAHIRAIMKSANPDMIRLEGSEESSYELRYVMWWD